MKVNKVMFCCLCLVLVGAVSVSAIDVVGTAPTLGGSDPVSQIVADQLNVGLNDAFDTIVKGLNDAVGDIKVKPTKLITAFGNSSVFSSHGSTQFGYEGYKLLGITIGPMVGFQIPASPFEIMDELDNISNAIMEEGDLNLGISPQLFSAQVSFNMSKLLGKELFGKDLYLGLRFGLIDLEDPFGAEGLSFNTFTIGVVANYQVLRGLDIGLFQWRGLSVGSGIIYNGTSIKFAFPLDPYNEPFGQGTPGFENASLRMDPELEMSLKVDTVTIPVEAVTSIKLLKFLNLSLGAGADIAFGKSALSFGMHSNMDIEGLGGSSIRQISPGKLAISAGGDEVPTFFNFKLMTGVGFNFGPVVVDIPMTFYANNGFNIGITLGLFL